MAFEAHGRANHSPVSLALQQQAIPSPNDGASAKLLWITFSVVSAGTAGRPRAEPLKRARTESDANAAMLLLSCMRREDSLPALGAPVAA